MKNLITAFAGKAKFAVLWAVYDEKHTFFTDWLPENEEAVESVHLFDSHETLWEYLLANYEKPEDMWYWVVDLRGENPVCMCCGACDPYDKEPMEEQLFKEE